MSSPAYDIAQYLASQGVGVFGGSSAWSINVSREPASPDDCITLYDTGGAGLDTDDRDIDRVSFQVRVRSFDYLSARAMQVAIRDLLLIDPGVAAGGNLYTISQESNIMHIGRDENDRQILTANYLAFVQEVE